MEFVKKSFFVFFVSFHIFSTVLYAFPVTVNLYTPSQGGVLDAYLDAAGYSDMINWGQSDYHPHDPHELLSGEWGAAIYYDGNPKEPSAMWLTNQFLVPNWPTYCDFIVNSYSSWNDLNNPVDGCDTARSVISNNDVQITIDYEIADLGVHHYSPLSYHEPGGYVYIALSERYVLLQTYTIKNIKESGDINGLEFYQMLHGHGADVYDANVHCSYQTTSFSDALSNYTPYNPVHHVGNFRYDVTQWNDAESADHVDWVGFSCTIEPNIHECNYYAGHGSEPTTGTHKDIEQRNLDNTNYSHGETAGAMGWYLPNLVPGQTTSITVAFMFGTTDWPCPAILTKDDNIPDGNCVLPGSPITYTIHYEANGLGDDNVRIIDYLPSEVDYISSSPDGNYNPNDRTVIWILDTVPEDYNQTFTLNVQVNNLAEPCGVILNRCEVRGDVTYRYAEKDTNVCPWNPGVIYVDCDRTEGKNTGMRWEDAYLALQSAIDRAKAGNGSEIWVAEGVYTPPDNIWRFYLVDGVPIYGHFAGNETSREQRNFTDAENETILKAYSPSSTIVNATNVHDGTIVDGFTIRDAYAVNPNSNGVKIENSNLAITNCLITNNYYGINAFNSSFTITDCVIKNCGGVSGNYGIYANFNSNSSLAGTKLANNIIRNNRGWGVYFLSVASRVVMIDNLVHNNSSGISISGGTPEVIVRNNTIGKAQNTGLYISNTISATISNCIFWCNDTNLSPTSRHATYSRINDSNAANHNINTDPCFVNVDSNNFHLKPASLGIDAGDPSFNDFNELDIDGECRIADGDNNGIARVDMGADECYWPKADYDVNEIVNFVDFAILAAVWQEPNSNRSLDADTDVDIDDLNIFCNDWLWIAPWSPLYSMPFGEYDGGDMDMMAEGPDETQVLTEEMPNEAVADEQPQDNLELTISREQMEELITWTQELWESSPEIRALISQADFERFLALLNAQIGE